MSRPSNFNVCKVVSTGRLFCHVKIWWCKGSIISNFSILKALVQSISQIEDVSIDFDSNQGVLWGHCTWCLSVSSCVLESTYETYVKVNKELVKHILIQRWIWILIFNLRFAWLSLKLWNSGCGWREQIVGWEVTWNGRQ